MCRVDLDPVEARGVEDVGGVSEALDDVFDLRDRQRGRFIECLPQAVEKSK